MWVAHRNFIFSGDANLRIDSVKFKDSMAVENFLKIEVEISPRINDALSYARRLVYANILRTIVFTFLLFNTENPLIYKILWKTLNILPLNTSSSLNFYSAQN